MTRLVTFREIKKVSKEKRDVAPRFHRGLVDAFEKSFAKLFSREKKVSKEKRGVAPRFHRGLVDAFEKSLQTHGANDPVGNFPREKKVSKEKRGVAPRFYRGLIGAFEKSLAKPTGLNDPGSGFCGKYAGKSGMPRLTVA